MAGRGPIPKPAGARHGHRKDPELTVLHGDGNPRGPKLPGDNWAPETVAWWDSWRRSPQAETFGGTDWDFLMDTALLHDSLWKGNPAVAAELRLRVAKMGATPEDRVRLRWEFADNAEPPSALGELRRRRIRVTDGGAGA